MQLARPHLAACAALWVALGLPGAGRAAASADGGPILVVAVDGMEWRVVLPLLWAGRLPHLAELARRGCAGSLRGTPPTESPVLWTTIATGRPPEQHGIRGFLLDEGGTRRLYTSADRRTKALWNIASEQGRRVAIVGWWVTYPAEPVNGVMISQTSTLERNDRTLQGKGTLLPRVSGQVQPPEREQELLARVAALQPGLDARIDAIFGPVGRDLGGLERTLWESSLWSLRADLVYRQLALDLLREDEPYDLVAVYFGGLDVLGHRFWRYREPERYTDRPDPALVEKLGGLLDTYTVEIDRAIGELVAAAGQNAQVVVLSDHGMQAVNQTASFRPPPERQLPSGAHLHAPPGVFVAAGPAFRSRPLDTLTSPGRREIPLLGANEDVAPTLLAVLGLPFGADMTGRPLEDLLAPAFLAAHPLRSVASYEGEAGAEQARAVRPHPLSEERIQQLRDLGYVE